MSKDAFSSLMSSTDPAVVVVTTAADGEQAGCLVGFHTQSSIEAERYCFWLSKANHTYRVSLRSTHLAIHFLTAGDLAVAERFGTLTGEETNKFSGITIDTVESGVPLLRAVPNRLVVERTTMLDDGGDHVGITARVASAVTTGPFTPLRLSDVGHLNAGRDSEERAIYP
ncbi:flavin reductase family protein [Microbacterium sp. A93]|uniref:flavin reductase family protein n=1 Tax=Microbacterium sp. A93 TaxID=3450716 RepID=UPI003F433988